MKKIGKRLLAALLCLCMVCALVPAAFAADATYSISYELDKESYAVGDTITAKLVLDQHGVTGGFELYSFTVDVGFKPMYLSYEGGTLSMSEFHIDKEASYWNVNYDKFRVTWHGLSSHITCQDHTVIATLKFKALKEIAETPLKSFLPSIGVKAGYSGAPDEYPDGKITIGNPAAETYKISFNGNGGTGTDPVIQPMAEKNQFVLPANPYTREHFSFQGWSDGEKTYQPGATYTMPAKDVTFTAQWKQEEYQISFVDDADAEGTPPSMEWMQVGKAFNMRSQGSLEKEGYTFAGWNDGEKTYQPGDSYTMPAKNVTFTAQWKKSQYTLRYDGNGATSGAAPGEMQYSPKTTIKLPASNTLKKTGYSFVGWSYNGTTYAPGSEFIMPEADVTFTAVWKQDSNTGGGGGGGGGTVTTTYPVNITAPTNGSLTADKKAAEQGTTITITATPNQGYSLGKITVVDKNGKEIAVTAKDGVYTFTMPASAVTVSASFQQSGSKPSHDSCKKDESCPIYPFVDSNPKAWYHDGVHYCLDEGLMNGIGDKQFAPDLTTSRAMIVTILYRLEGKPATTTTGKYDDVPAGQWYSEAVSWADANGVVKGFGDGTFRPDDDITREQMATIFQRYAALKNKADGKKADLSGYTDAAEVSLWALEGMQWANGTGLIQGRTATTLAPGATATRAEAATILLRFCTGILK